MTPARRPQVARPWPPPIDSVLNAAPAKPGPDPVGIRDLTDEDMDRFHRLIDE